MTSYSLAELFYRGFDLFPTIISNGEFDRVMVRPRSPILQVLGSKIEFTRIGRLLQSFVMFTYAIPASGINFGFDKIFLLAFMIFGGTVL
ncbi:MAG TPA: ABC-2 family transporter protein, partial [Lachnospiraceae bacterium]|nr:ABC-2 family transporter protein [Lachnospiraceae bacterium]